MFTKDLALIFQWWFMLFVVGIASFPLVTLFFKKFFDGGYGLTKISGVVIFSYIIFFLSITHLLPLKETHIYLILELYVAVNFVILLAKRKVIWEIIKQKKWIILFQEILFFAGLIFWSFVRGHAPDINGLEKFMDYGFINSILKSNFLPPQDMWFAGKAINYYWFGHFWSALLTKLSGVSPSATYNLLLATILGFGLSASFSISSTLASLLKKNSKKLAFSAGIISALLLIFAGNFHTPFYVLKEGASKYWYPDATRFIGYNPETNDKTIHEFPIYSFVVSDLHAHVLNFPFVLLTIAVLANLTVFEFGKNSLDKKRGGKESIQKLSLFQKAKLLVTWSEFGLGTLFAGFLIGVMFMTSTWDFGNYLLTSGFVLLTYNIYRYKFSITAFLKTAVSLVFFICIAILTATSAI